MRNSQCSLGCIPSSRLPCDSVPGPQSSKCYMWRVKLALNRPYTFIVVHPQHAQPEDDGDRRPAVRGDDGGTGCFEADFGAVELSRPRSRMYPRRSSMDLRATSRIGALVLPLAFVLAGCDVSLGHLAHSATDEWSH